MGIAYPFESLATISDCLFHAAIEDRMQNLFLAFEIEIDRAVGDAGFTSDVRDFGIKVTVVGEDANGRA
jgi:hypothetical protein